MKRWWEKVRDFALYDGKIAVPHLEIHITHQCNLTCESCLHFSNFGHTEALSVDALKYSMSQWNTRLLPKSFAILGGEPSLHKNLVEIVYLTREMWPSPKTRIELTTNGLLLHRHPGLPRALADTNTFLAISIHSNGSISPKYQVKIARTLDLVDKWQREFGINLEKAPATPWHRGYKGSGSEMMPFEDGAPDKSWSNCVTGQECFQLFEDCLWKCAPIAYLQLQNRKFSLSSKWDAYLGYQPLRPGCTDEEIRDFFDRKAESVCGMCPSEPKSFTKKDPLLPLRHFGNPRIKPGCGTGD